MGYTDREEEPTNERYNQPLGASYFVHHRVGTHRVDGAVGLMKKYSSSAVGRGYAEEEAREKGLFFGWSALSAGWYVGTREELGRVGVLEPLYPDNERTD